MHVQGHENTNAQTFEMPLPFFFSSFVCSLNNSGLRQNRVWLTISCIKLLLNLARLDCSESDLRPQVI